MKKLSKLEFVLKANKTHKNKYDYSLVEYKNSKTKVKIICPKHGVFEQRPNDHLNNHGCSKCGNIIVINDNKLNNISFINKAKKIHDDKYDYSECKYIDSKTKVKIICPKHGVFEQRPNNHLNGQKCPKCFPQKIKKSNIDFIKEANEIHMCFFDYSLVEYKNSKTKVKIICPKHGVFEQTPNMHLLGQGCPICSESKGEKRISEFLSKKNIKYVREKKFNDCKNVNLLMFDFYLPNKHIIIEYDGIQHFKPRDFFGGINGYKKIIKNDEIKNRYCMLNNIKLIKIAYYENVELKLSKYFE